MLIQPEASHRPSPTSPWFFTWGAIFSFSSPQTGFISDPRYDYAAYGGALIEQQSDALIHELKVNITRPLTAKEKQVIEKLMGEIATVDTAISSLPDNALVILPGGSTVTATELKALWAKADFVVNDIGFKYNEGTPQENTRGQADFNNNDPVISFNINTVQSYVDDPSASGRGGFWVILHEIGHMTSASRSNYNATFNDADGYTEADRQSHERYANDFAKVLSDALVGDSPSLNHISSENPYSAGNGNLYIPDATAPTSFIPSWKFDTVDGGGLVPSS